MSLRDFARSLRPGNDQQLAADLATQSKVQRSRGATRAARQGQAWEDADRNRDKRGGWYRAR
ncbi:hypothetical protein PV728_48210 [Streptomyces europaeiscabiei]|uniref:hypothetical protein n=1 Tax=Streptomyces europaeiscabiei TaxID=146819 RepID=UPI0029A24DF1|nr:hypothetical protein [Streptomyces europaeiscabiei]MDX3637834.1 hypothetical protein [Streptomyces europaeiscabiei]MDX3655640.1 hypothetical protein [Streptomyces europaeiscabiei]